MVMKLGKILLKNALVLDSLLDASLGEALTWKPFLLCQNQLLFKAPLLSKAFGRLGKLSNLGLDGKDMTSTMGYLLANNLSDGLLFLGLKANLL